MGKPSKLLFEQACQNLGAQAGKTLMVGDDIHTDVRGAQQAGLKGALVRTGKYRDKDLNEGVIPDLVLDSFADLPYWWGDNE
jgi:phospholysine phosphohistidine inorganic pyrophosphate phosphatase